MYNTPVPRHFFSKGSYANLSIQSQGSRSRPQQQLSIQTLHQSQTPRSLSSTLTIPQTPLQPEELVNAPSITTLNLSSSSLTAEELAQSFRLYPQLTSLDLRGNWLDSFPPNCSHFLTVLDLSDNRLSDLHGFDDGRLPNLKELYCSRNRLTSLLGLSRSSSLVVADFSFNSLSVVEGLERHCHLTTLNLSSNNLQSYSSIRSLSLNTALKALDLTDNVVSTRDWSKFKFKIRHLLPGVTVQGAREPPQLLGSVGHPGGVGAPVGSHPLNPGAKSSSGSPSGKARSGAARKGRSDAGSGQRVDVVGGFHGASSSGRGGGASSVSFADDEDDGREGRRLKHPTKTLPWRKAPDPLPHMTREAAKKMDDTYERAADGRDKKQQEAAAQAANAGKMKEVRASSPATTTDPRLYGRRAGGGGAAHPPPPPPAARASASTAGESQSVWWTPSRLLADSEGPTFRPLPNRPDPVVGGDNNHKKEGPGGVLRGEGERRYSKSSVDGEMMQQTGFSRGQLATQQLPSQRSGTAATTSNLQKSAKAKRTPRTKLRNSKGGSKQAPESLRDVASSNDPPESKTPSFKFQITLGRPGGGGGSLSRLETGVSPSSSSAPRLLAPPTSRSDVAPESQPSLQYGYGDRTISLMPETPSDSYRGSVYDFAASVYEQRAREEARDQGLPARQHQGLYTEGTNPFDVGLKARGMTEPKTLFNGHNPSGHKTYANNNHNQQQQQTLQMRPTSASSWNPTVLDQNTRQNNFSSMQEQYPHRPSLTASELFGPSPTFTSPYFSAQVPPPPPPALLSSFSSSFARGVGGRESRDEGVKVPQSKEGQGGLALDPKLVNVLQHIIDQKKAMMR